VVEIPTNVLYQQHEPAAQRPGARVYSPGALRSAADPAAVERAVDALERAERPLLVAGDGVFWSDAAAELAALAQALQVPVYTRRAAQGAVPEDDPLAVRGAWKKSFTGRADVIVAVGFTFWSGEHFGQAPTWSRDATMIQVDAVPARVGWHVAAEIPIVGDPKLVLGQLVAAARARGLDRAARNDTWLAEVARVRAEFDRALREHEAGVRDALPIHPARLTRDLLELADRDATFVIDSFTLSGWLSQSLVARFPGQVVDAGPLAPVGHGIGMGIGVQLARPGKQVIIVAGDGGFGIGAMELETALKHGLPLVTVLWNNGSWGPSFEQMPMLRGRVDAFDMLPELRYDRMFEAIGCHGEHVTHPDALRPALTRALAAGKPALVNVIGDPRVGHARLGGNLLGS
jgi:acetolactate synthase I/II/III large subunit